jgi:hypothetical protein
MLPIAAYLPPFFGSPSPSPRSLLAARSCFALASLSPLLFLPAILSAKVPAIMSIALAIIVTATSFKTSLHTHHHRR